jgi:hypothetical protein
MVSGNLWLKFFRLCCWWWWCWWCNWASRRGWIVWWCGGQGSFVPRWWCFLRLLRVALQESLPGLPLPLSASQSVTRLSVNRTSSWASPHAFHTRRMRDRPSRGRSILRHLSMMANPCSSWNDLVVASSGSVLPSSSLWRRTAITSSHVVLRPIPVTHRNRLFTHTGISAVMFCFSHLLVMLQQSRERRLFTWWLIKMTFRLVTEDLMYQK